LQKVHYTNLHFLRVERYLLDEFSIEVVYGRDVSDAYYDSARIIEVNNRQNIPSRLHSLLHEAGHASLRNEKRRVTFGKNFPFMRKHGVSKRGDKNHRIDVIREEVLAWERGYEIALELDIPIDQDLWSKHRRDALVTYLEWF